MNTFNFIVWCILIPLALLVLYVVILIKHYKKETLTDYGWVGRDRDDKLNLYKSKPFKKKDEWVYDADLDEDYFNLDKNQFPEVKWTDCEPTKVKIILKIKD